MQVLREKSANYQRYNKAIVKCHEIGSIDFETSLDEIGTYLRRVQHTTKDMIRFDLKLLSRSVKVWVPYKIFQILCPV